MSVFEMAQTYYPRLWDVRRLEALVKAGKLTQAEADQIQKENGTAQKAGVTA